MLKPSTSRQSKMELVYIENLVPEDHLLRKIDKYIDFSFINEICKPYYCADNGRPAIEPEIMFKMLFIGYLYGIRSETRLVEEVKVNLAYRWFLGYGIEDKIPDASVIWQNRIRRFNGTDIPRRIFNEILRQAIENKLVDGKVLYSDSTHLKANANKNRFEEAIVEQESQAYIKELNNSINEDRMAHGKKPLKFEEAPVKPEKEEDEDYFDDDENKKDGGKGVLQSFLNFILKSQTHRIFGGFVSSLSTIFMIVLFFFYLNFLGFEPLAMFCGCHDKGVASKISISVATERSIEFCKNKKYFGKCLLGSLECTFYECGEKIFY